MISPAERRCGEYNTSKEIYGGRPVVVIDKRVKSHRGFTSKSTCYVGILKKESRNKQREKRYSGIHTYVLEK